VAKTNKQSLCTNSLQTRRYIALSDQGNIQPWFIREPSGTQTAFPDQGTIKKVLFVQGTIREINRPV
jgi:hypothetical protein